MNAERPRARSCELGRMARVAADMGAPFIAAILDAGRRQLWRAPRTEATILGWIGDPRTAAVAMRFNAALHFLARRGTPPTLAALYRGDHQDFDGAIGEALAEQDDLVAGFLSRTPQTNEVGRAAAIVAALLAVRQQFGLPFELIEIGSSCGLNLNLDRYAYHLGGVLVGDGESPVQIAPRWTGPAPVPAPLEIVAARGVDLNPLDPHDPATCERLKAYIWADQPWRIQRLEQALVLARRHPPRLDQGDATTWLTAQLARPQPDGVCRIVMHSMVWQYLQPEHRTALAARIHAAGRPARVETPLAWIGLEWTEARDEVHLSLEVFPGDGQRRVLATCHPYGNALHWHSADDASADRPLPAALAGRGPGHERAA